MKGLDMAMADILQQLMQLEMQNKGNMGGRPARPTMRPSPFGSISRGAPYTPPAYTPPEYTPPVIQGMSPQATTPPPPPPPEKIFALSRPEPIPEIYAPPKPDIFQQPEIYPQDISPLGAVNHPIQRRYTQDAGGNQVEIGYDGQPISGYTPDQMALHNATMGITPSQSKYVFNGQGYDLVPNTPQGTGVNIDTGGVRLSNGQFIGGYQNPNGGMEIGTPSFFQQYAGNPELVRALSDAYGYDISNPDIVASMQRQPQYQPETAYMVPDRPVPTQSNERGNDPQESMENMINKQFPNPENPRMIAENPRSPEEIIPPPRRQYG